MARLFCEFQNKTKIARLQKREQVLFFVLFFVSCFTLWGVGRTQRLIIISRDFDSSSFHLKILSQPILDVDGMFPVLTQLNLLRFCTVVSSIDNFRA